MRADVSAAVLVAALFLTGLAAPVHAGESLQAHAEAETVRTAGISLVSARLLALLQESDGDPLSPAGFRLDAQSVVVETTARDPTIHAGGVAAGLDPTTSSDEFSDATVTGLRARPGDRFDVFPLPGHSEPRLHAQTGCTDWAAPGKDEVRRDPRVPTKAERSALVRVAGGAVLRECDANGQWTVTGDFLVMLWERDFQVEDADGRREVQSGRLNVDSQALADRDPPQHSVARDQEVYLYVGGGSLTVPMDATTSFFVAPDAELSGATGLEFRKATFRLGTGTVPVEATSLSLGGTLDMVLRPSGSRLDFKLQGTLVEGEADGSVLGSVHEQAMTKEVASLPWATGALGALAATALAAIGLLASTKRRGP